MIRALLVTALAGVLAVPSALAQEDKKKGEKGDMDFEPDEVSKSGPASKTAGTST